MDKKAKVRSMRKKWAVSLSIGMMIVLLGCYLYYENKMLQVSHYEITNATIPDEFKGYKIVQVSDFHNEKSTRLTSDLIYNIGQENPDMIVITGDLVDSRRTDIGQSISFVKEIVKIAPVYYINGNHESRISGYELLKEELEELGVVILENSVETIEMNDAVINLIGIEDPSFIHTGVVNDAEIVKAELGQLQYDESTFNILLSHRPELFATYVEENMNLVLTGHAHGGQIRLPFVGGLVAPNQGVLPEYTEGEFIQNETAMIVSRGIGNSIFPFRVNNRPELVVISLH